MRSKAVYHRSLLERKIMVNPHNKLAIQYNAQYFPKNTPCSCIDYLIIFLPQESSHSACLMGYTLTVWALFPAFSLL